MLSITELRKLLEVTEGASPDDINRAFRKVSVRHHPDKGGNRRHFELLCKARDALSSPEAIRDYEAEYAREVAEHTAKLDTDIYKAQFNSYNQWFKHCLQLIKTVRLYRRSFFSFKGSDTAADALLRKLETKEATIVDLHSFIDGAGSWEKDSTKTLFFELLHGPVEASNAEQRKEHAIRWIARLGEISFSDNPNEDPTERELLTGELKHFTARRFAIAIELSYLQRHLNEAELKSDPLAVSLVTERELVERALEILFTHIAMSNAHSVRWSDCGGPLAAELLRADIELTEISYLMALSAISVGDNDLDELTVRQSRVRSTKLILEAEREAEQARIRAAEEAARLAAIAAAEREAAEKARAAEELAAKQAAEEAARLAAEAAARPEPAAAGTGLTAGSTTLPPPSPGTPARTLGLGMFYTEAQTVAAAGAGSATAEAGSPVATSDAGKAAPVKPVTVAHSNGKCCGLF